MKLSKIGATALALGVLGVGAAWSAGLWSTLPIVGSASFCAGTVTGFSTFGGTTGQGQGTGGPICSQTVPAGPTALTGQELVPADLGAGAAGGGGGPVQTVTIPSALLANMSGTPRNYLENGAMNVNQRIVQTTLAAGITTCGTTTGVAINTAATGYGIDRWGCDANVGSGAGRTLQVTSSPSPPTGFNSSLKVYRTSGILTQPVCAMQEIPTARSVALQGKTVTLSVYEIALAALASDNNSITTLSIITGTATDDGLGLGGNVVGMTASPAITPAWTGLTNVVNQSPVTISTTWGRYSVTGTIPATATEVGVLICFTPTAAAVAGTTDGFAFTGAQLEVAPSPTAFEFLPYRDELATAQRYFSRRNELATTLGVVASCAASTTSLMICNYQFPQVMRAVPNMVYIAGFASSLIAQTSLVNCASLATSTAVSGQSASLQAVPIACGSSAAFTGNIGGVAAMLFDNGGAGSISASADF